MIMAQKYLSYTLKAVKQMSNVIKGTVSAKGTIKGKVHTGASDLIATVRKAIAEANKIASITLYASKWEGEASPYSQVVNVSGVTDKSKIDLNPTVEQLNIFYSKDISFVVGNNNGIITVYCIGQKPTNDYTLQATITEVTVI